jgi:hypothetical protein
MAWLSQLLKHEWKDIKGHFKYDAYKYVTILVGGGVIALGAYLLHRIGHVPDWTPYACIFVLFLFVFIWMTRHSPVSVLHTPSQSLPDHFAETNTSSAVPLDPKKANLKAELLELYFQLERLRVSNDVHVLTFFRVVNHGEQDAVITDWQLEAKIGENSYGFETVDIPANWRIRVLDVGTPIIKDLDRVLPTGPLRCGVPQTYWVNFRMQSLSRPLPPHNAQFDLILVDALGNRHEAFNCGPLFIEDCGEIITE